MSDVFDVDRVLDVPVPGLRAVILRARVDLDLSTEQSARSELLGAVDGPEHALVLDVTGVFVGVVLVRCIGHVAERAARAGKPLAVAGAPAWLIDLITLLDVPPLVFRTTPAAAVAALCTAAGTVEGSAPAAGGLLLEPRPGG